MALLNVRRVTEELANDIQDPFTFESCVDLQREGKQIVQVRCGHFMEEQALASWVQQVINRPENQDQIVRCPMCRASLMDRSVDRIVIGGMPEDIRQGAQGAGQAQARRDRTNNTFKGMLFIGGTAVFTASFLSYLIGRGLLAKINPDDPLTLNEFEKAILGFTFTLAGQVGMALGGLAALIGGAQIAASAAVNFAAEKTQQVARSLYHWFRGQ